MLYWSPSIPKANFCVWILIAGLSLVILQGCAHLYVQTPSLPLNQEEIARFISSYKEQERLVNTFFSSGRLVFLERDSESDSNILVLGKRDPLRIKIEITHPWGRPLFHILISDDTLHVLSFPEKRYYLGPIESAGPAWFFPASLGPDQIWTFARGYPMFPEYDRAISLRGNQITLLDGEEKPLQVVETYPESTLPRLILFPGQGVSLSFSGFKHDERIYYARKTRLEDPGTESALVLNLKQMVFNKPIPESIFQMVIPANFKHEIIRKNH